MTSQHEFLRGEFQTMSLTTATQHIRIYADGAREDDRKRVRAAIREQLDTLSRQYADTEVGESQHVENIAAFAHAISTQFADVLAPGGFRIGPAQKALNVYLKYLWCAGMIHRPPHCPVDAIVLREAGHTGILWSKMETIDEYQDAIAVLRKAAGNMPLAQWELDAWRNGKASAMQGSTQIMPSCHTASSTTADPHDRVAVTDEECRPDAAGSPLA